MTEQSQPDEQDQPVEAGSTEASDDEKLDGLLQQVRSDVRAGVAGDPATMLRQRLSDVGLEVDEAGFERLLAQVTH